MSKLKAFFETRNLRLWHPDSPGMRVDVRRNWLQRLLYPKDFATLNESIQYSKRERCRPR